MASDAISIIKPGSEIEFRRSGDEYGRGRLRGTLLAACIYPTHVEYRVEWWSGAVRNDQWIPESAIEAAESFATQRIGFQ